MGGQVVSLTGDLTALDVTVLVGYTDAQYHRAIKLLKQALEVHPGGYYAWLHQPLSDREIEDSRLTSQIKQYWLESGGHSGYRNIHEDLLEAKIDCGRDRVLRLMRQAGLRAQRGYKAPKGYYGGTVHPAAPNLLAL